MLLAVPPDSFIPQTHSLCEHLLSAVNGWGTQQKMRKFLPFLCLFLVWERSGGIVSVKCMLVTPKQHILLSQLEWNSC